MAHIYPDHLDEHTAVRLSRQGFWTLIVCNNSNLAADLRERLTDVAPQWSMLDVDAFHHLCIRLAREHGVSIPKSDSMISITASWLIGSEYQKEDQEHPSMAVLIPMLILYHQGKDMIAQED